MKYVIWEFKTRNFTVRMTAEEEFDLDLSWDETGEIADKINRGDLDVFCAKCAVYYRGAEIAADYLGQCIYESPDDFRDHIGLAVRSRADGRNYGSYFSDMVRESIAQARKTLCSMPRIRCA